MAFAKPPWSSKETFDFCEGTQDLPPIHPLHKLRTREAVAVLPGDGPTAIDDEVRYLLGDAAHLQDTIGVRGVQSRPDVQASHAGVAVEAGPGTVLLHDLLEAVHEILQPVRRHGSVLHESDRFLFVCSTEQKRQGRLAEFNRLAHLGLLAEPCSSQRTDLAGKIVESCEPFVELPLPTAPLHDEDGLRVSLYKAGRVSVGGVGPRAAYGDVVEQLYRRWVHLQETACGARCGGEGIELKGGQGAGFGK